MRGELAVSPDYENEDALSEFADPEVESHPRHLHLVISQVYSLEQGVLGEAETPKKEYLAPTELRPIALLAKDSNRYPLLNSKAKEKDLAQRIERGDLEAKDILIGSNVRLVMHNAKRYKGQGLDYEDLVQEGTLGLIRAAEKYDWRKGFKFSTYATWWIRQSVARGIMKTGKTVRIPTHLAQDLHALHNAETGLTLKLGHEPSDEELAQHTKFDVHQIKELREVDQQVLSLNIPMGDGKNPAELGELLPSADDTAAEAEANILQSQQTREINYILDRLNSEDLRLLEHTYGLNDKPVLSTAEIARRLNISREAVSKRQKKVLRLVKGLGGKYLANAVFEPEY